MDFVFRKLLPKIGFQIRLLSSIKIKLTLSKNITQPYLKPPTFVMNTTTKSITLRPEQ